MSFGVDGTSRSAGSVKSGGGGPILPFPTSPTPTGGASLLPDRAKMPRAGSMAQLPQHAWRRLFHVYVAKGCFLGSEPFRLGLVGLRGVLAPYRNDIRIVSMLWGGNGEGVAFSVFPQRSTCIWDSLPQHGNEYSRGSRREARRSSKHRQAVLPSLPSVPGTRHRHPTDLPTRPSAGEF